MVDPPFDEYLDTPNKSTRQDVPRKGVCLHHAALTSLDYLQQLAMGAKEVSATAIAKDRISKRLMADGFRAWSLSSAWADSSFRSVETCNQSAEGWTISDESHWELAYLVAYWATVDGFWPHRDGDPRTWTVLGHREVYTIYGVSYGTACPGGMDLDLVTKRAQGLLRGATTTPTLGEDMPILIRNDTPKSAANPYGFELGVISGGRYEPVQSMEEVTGISLAIGKAPHGGVWTGYTYPLWDLIIQRLTGHTRSAWDTDAPVLTLTDEQVASLALQLGERLDVPTAAENAEAVASELGNRLK